LNFKSHPTLQPITTSEKTHHIASTRTNGLILMKEVMGVVRIIRNT